MNASRNANMNLTVTTRYLLFSVNPLASEKTVLIRRNGQLLLDMTMRLDAIYPKHEVAVDMERFGPGEIEVSCEPAMEIPARLSDDPVWPEDLYREAWRPRAHFTAKRGWINDPNGLVWYHGVWHLFYQYNPVGRDWGNMHWGHAVSADLVHWEELAVALFPDEMGTMFSGSAIVDTDNLLGLNSAQHEAILLYYTCAGDTSVLSKGKPFTQCLAVSTNGGNTFVKHSRNPLIPQLCPGNRDPKVIRSPQGGYVMALYLEKNSYGLLHSENLLDWVPLQTLDLPEDTECPDFYPLPVPKQAVTGTTLPDPLQAASYWILSGAADHYFIGTYDGKTFTPEGPASRLHWGTHAYAAQSWSDVPSGDGRRIRISWNTSDLPGTPFNRSMTTPCEMTLQTVSGRLQLCLWPVREFEALWQNTRTEPDQTASATTPLSLPLSYAAHDISCTLSWVDPSTVLHLSLFGARLCIDTGKNTLSLHATTAGMPEVPFEPISLSGSQTLSLRIIADLTGVEIYLGRGTSWMSQGHCADPNLAQLMISAEGGTVAIQNLTISELASIWDSNKV